MARNISVDGLADAVRTALAEYTEQTAEDVKRSVKKTADMVRKDIQENAPKRTGKYAKSWTARETRKSSRAVTVTVYSRDQYRLTHLLEYGHAKRGGGRVLGTAHIAPAEERGMKFLEDDLERRLRKDG